MKMELSDLDNSFYGMAPGSYYNRDFWNKKININFVNEYNQLNSRSDYLKWLSRHGGNPAAVAHLKRMGFSRFLNPDAVSFWNSLLNASYDVPSDLLDLYSLGEHDLGNEYYKMLYEGRISYQEELRRWIYIGMKTDNLYLSVYYTRTLMRYLHIPEDPFSLPAGLLKQLYPRPYHESVSRHSRRFNLDESIVYGLMRQESMFRERATSRSGAMGLMQVMPKTGAWMAGKLKIQNPDYYNPDTSILIGTYYFSDLIRQYDGEFRWASMAYNGGPGNLRKWKREYYKGDFYLFLENLHVAETRNYVRFTYENAMHYKTVYTLYP
jgi:soluble lytic murein transglycosylase-like protein